MSVQAHEQDGEMPGGQQMLENGDEIHHLDQEVVYATSSTMNTKVLQRNYGEMSNEMIEVIAADELMAEAVEEVGEMAEGRPYMYEYDSMVHTQHDQNIIYQLYQPLETSDGTFVCRICLELGETVEFANKPAYTHHRYKIHGSYNNNHICPVLHCREIYASMGILRKHLLGDHKLPIEMHYQTFANVPEFERFRHSVESICNCRFMMHTKQPHNKRQIMHCSKSEHKLILQSRRHKLPTVRMAKEGAWCPAQISFKIDSKTGRVEAFYQLYHCGHAKEYGNVQDNEMANSNYLLPSGPVDIIFTPMPERPADRPMQYLQIDLVSADSCVYVNTIYSHILIMTDLKTGYMFAKPIPEGGERQLLIRILTDIFLQFGVPEGFSSNHSVTLIREVMSAIAGIFRVNMKEILFDKSILPCLNTDYDTFLQALYEQAIFELQSKHRWVEMVQFTTMVLNQTGKKSAFERMFNRKPYNLPDHKVAPWLLGEEFSLGDEDAELDVVFDEQDDEVAEQPNEIQFGADVPRHEVGDKVYLRNFDLVPGRGNSLPYLYGYISEVDEHSPRFPYRVHFSKSKEPWPNETSVSAWVNPYDVLPITHGLIVIPDEDRISAASLLLCSCGGGEYGTPCSLFRSYLCSNGMAKACCLKSGKICEYHEEYADGDDTYGRLEALSKSFTGNQPRTKTRKRIPHLTPANAPLPNEQGNVDSMPVLTSENTAPRAKRKRMEQESVDTLPEVLTIVVENKDRTLVPAISKKCTGEDTQKKETEGIPGRVDEPAASTSGVNLLPSKGLKVDDLEEHHSVEPPLFAEEKPLSLEKRQEDALKPHVRRSERSSKAKVFEDYVPIP